MSLSPLSPVVSVVETAKQFVPKYSHAGYIFSHLGFSHRQQRYMLIKMLEAARSPATPTATLKEMFAFWDELLAVHTQSEDEIFIPRLREMAAKNSPALVDRVNACLEALDAQHKAMAEPEEALKKALNNIDGETISDADRAVIADLIVKLGVFYHNHTHKEESEMIPLALELKEADRAALAKEIGLFFRNAKSIKYSLRAMSDVCAVDPNDAELWTYSLPWFVRNAVTKMVGVTPQFYAYWNLFGQPSASFDETFKTLFTVDSS